MVSAIKVGNKSATSEPIGSPPPGTPMGPATMPASAGAPPQGGAVGTAIASEAPGTPPPGVLMGQAAVSESPDGPPPGAPGGDDGAGGVGDAPPPGTVPGAPPATPGEDLERWTLQAVCGRWLANLGGDKTDSSSKAASTTFPWPGGRTDMPKEKELDLAEDALLPMQPSKRPDWVQLWRLAGPTWPDRLTVLVGSTGRGKSAWALQVAEAVARTGQPVLFVSAEMGTAELVARLVAVRAKGAGAVDVAYSALLRRAEVSDELQQAVVALQADCPALYLWEPESDKRNAAWLAAMVRAVSAAHGGAAPFVVLDYVQRFVEGQDRRISTSSFSRKLRDLARPDGLGTGWPGAAVLAISSTARSYYEHFQSCEQLLAAHKGGTVQMKGRTKSNGDPLTQFQPAISLEGMGKETGELEYDAPLVLCVTSDTGPESGEPSPRTALVVVAKNRHGSAGFVRMRFLPACGRFEEEFAPGATDRLKYL